MAALVSSEHVRADATYEYDELGRVKTVTYADGAQVSYSYDPADNRTQQQKSLAGSNQFPSAGNDSISLEVGQALTFDPLANDSDPESQALKVIGLTAAAEGDVTIVSERTELNYQSTGVSASTDSFDYYVQDPLGGITTATVDVTISMPANSPPDAVNDGSISWAEQSTYYFDPRANDTDPDGDELEITSVTNGTYATTEIVNDGDRLRITTSSVFEPTPDSFTYTITDGNGGTDTATVSYVVYDTSGQPPL